MPQQNHEPPAEWRYDFATFAEESERATAMLAGDILSEALQQLIGRRLHRSDFAYRIEAAHDLQLISEAERDDLRLIRQIRSEFAHRLDAHFDDPAITELCLELRAGRSIVRATVGPRAYFVATAALVDFALTAKRLRRNGRAPG